MKTKKVLYTVSNIFSHRIAHTFLPQSFDFHHFTTHIYSSHYTPLSPLPYAALHCTSLHCTSLHFTSLHFYTLLDDFHFTSLHFTSLHFTSLHFNSLHFTSFHYTFQWFSAHFIIFFYPKERIFFNRTVWAPISIWALERKTYYAVLVSHMHIVFRWIKFRNIFAVYIFSLCIRCRCEYVS